MSRVEVGQVLGCLGHYAFSTCTDEPNIGSSSRVVPYMAG